VAREEGSIGLAYGEETDGPHVVFYFQWLLGGLDFNIIAAITLKVLFTCVNISYTPNVVVLLMLPVLEEARGAMREARGCSI
jgi:hypothetical protein